MNRSLTLDIAKGIGIILVVVGHCIKSYTIPGIFIYAFHMPLFFLISGVCFNGEKYQELKPFLYKRMRQLIVPAVVFTAVIVLMSHFLLNDDGPLHDLLWKGFPNPIWFLGVLFIVEIVYWLLYRLSKTKIAICIYIGRTRQILWGAKQMLTQNCCQTIHEEWYVFDSFHLCTEAFDL